MLISMNIIKVMHTHAPCARARARTRARARARARGSPGRLQYPMMQYSRWFYTKKFGRVRTIVRFRELGGCDLSAPRRLMMY